MESVEIWMWIIAGMLIASIMFVGGFQMLSKYVENSEKSLAQDNFNLLSSTINSVCIGGSFREVKSMKFPFSVSKIYVRDEDGIENYGNELCYDFKEENCVVFDGCNVEMKTINLQKKTGVFYKIKSFLGSKAISQIRFSVEASAPGEAEVDWKQEVA